MSDPTLLDIAKLNNDDGVVALVEEGIKAVPEIERFPASTIPGQSFVVPVRETLPTVGFRMANEGVATTKSAWSNKLVETFLLDASVEVDEAVADGYKGGAQAFLAKEAAGLMRSGMISIGSQIYYGTATTVATSAANSPTDGFPGLLELYDSSNMEVDIGGTGSAGSSVWLVWFHDDQVQLVVGQNGEIEVKDPYRTRLTDSSSYPYEGWRLPMKAYVGLSCVNPTETLVRIRDLTTATGKKLTDDYLAQAWDKLPAAARPSDCAFFLSKRSLMQLQRSRTATTTTGADAPIPSEWNGVPLIVTDSIKDTETCV